MTEEHSKKDRREFLVKIGIGAGVVGSHAAQMAIGLGANVVVLDRNQGSMGRPRGIL